MYVCKWPSSYAPLRSSHVYDLTVKLFFQPQWEGKDIIKQGRQMLGETQPLASTPGSIRGDYSIDLGRNICHGSDTPEAAKHELQMWFPEGVNEWAKTVDAWVYE